MTMIEGRHLGEFLARRPAQRLRDLIGERLLELFYFQILRLHAFHADPNAGNYLYGEGGSIGLIDFGCVKRMTPAFVANLSGLFLYRGARDSGHFQSVLEKRYAMFGETLRPAARRAMSEFAERFYRKVYPPRSSATTNRSTSASHPSCRTTCGAEKPSIAKARCQSTCSWPAPKWGSMTRCTAFAPAFIRAGSSGSTLRPDGAVEQPVVPASRKTTRCPMCYSPRFPTRHGDRIRVSPLVRRPSFDPRVLGDVRRGAEGFGGRDVGSRAGRGSDANSPGRFGDDAVHRHFRRSGCDVARRFRSRT